MTKSRIALSKINRSFRHRYKPIVRDSIEGWLASEPGRTSRACRTAYWRKIKVAEFCDSSKIISATMQKPSRLEGGRLSLRRPRPRSLRRTRPDANKLVFPAKVFRDEMAFGIGGQKLAVEIRWNIKKAVNRSPNELDFERMEAPAISNTGDVAGHNRFAFDV